MPAPVLTLAHVGKSFGATRALVDANLSLYPGEVTALLGENGAGKSTLVKILGGLFPPDSGEICIDGQPARIGSPAHARRLGISIVHQECVLFDNLSVAENILIDVRPRQRGFIAWRELRQRAAAILRQLDAPFDAERLVASLSIAEKHLVQIARGLAADTRLMIMDEPTAALSHGEVQDLYRIVQRLKAQGCAVLFISHRFEEVFALADRYAVFRDGCAVGEGPIAAATQEQLIRLMVGRELEPAGSGHAPTAASPGAESLRVEHLSRAGEFEDVSFEVRGGEILGMYGLVGAGRSEVMQCLFGITRADAGRIALAGRKVKVRQPDDAIRAGLAYVPEERQRQGAILQFSIAANIALPSLARLSRRGVPDGAAISRLAQHWIAALDIKAAGPDQPLEQLSGGNQQKVVLAKWLASQPKVLILDEPTKGIDVAAKAAVHSAVRGLAAQGLGIVMVSSELPEVLGAADRIVVMRRGRVRAHFTRAAASAERLATAASGL